MCSINGFIKITSGGLIGDPTRRMKEIMIAGCDRGRDAFGYMAFYDGGINSGRWLTSSVECAPSIEIPRDASIVLSNNRAEPTTE